MDLILESGNERHYAKSRDTEAFKSGDLDTSTGSVGVQCWFSS